MSASIAISPARRKTAFTAGFIAAVGVIAVASPVLGIPLVFAVAAYTAIRLSKPNAILRGRTLSADQHHRAAVIAGGGALAVAMLFTAISSALVLAGTLEHRLDDALKSAHRRGELTVGQVFEACDWACARAVVLELPTPGSPEIAKLSGFTRHEHSIYQWRNATERLEATTARR